MTSIALVLALSFGGAARAEDQAPNPPAEELAKPTCPTNGMVALPGYCIDKYEAPNTRGAQPWAFKTAQEGEEWCQSRGLRLCTENEWTRACKGARGSKYPYGSAYQRGVCNDTKIWKEPDWNKLAKYPAQEAMDEAKRLYQADPSGAWAGCYSEDHVYDMAGSVAEWVVRSNPTSSNYDHVLKGCFWSGCYHQADADCDFVNGAHRGSFRSYEAGFRCCWSPDPH